MSAIFKVNEFLKNPKRKKLSINVSYWKLFEIALFSPKKATIWLPRKLKKKENCKKILTKAKKILRKLKNHNFEVLRIICTTSYISVNTSRHIRVRPIQLYIFGTLIEFWKRLKKCFLQKYKFADISNFQSEWIFQKSEKKKDFQSM